MIILRFILIKYLFYCITAFFKRRLTFFIEVFDLVFRFRTMSIMKKVPFMSFQTLVDFFFYRIQKNSKKTLVPIDFHYVKNPPTFFKMHTGLEQHEGK